MGINIKRLMADLYELGKIGFIPGKGTSRVAYSEDFLKGRELIRSKMEEAGLIISQNAKEGTRPEKKVYHVSESGCKRFRELLYRTLDIDYRPFGWNSREETARCYTKAIEQTDVVIGNREEFDAVEYLSMPDNHDNGRSADVLLEQGVKLVIVKDGPRGSWGYVKNRPVEQCGVIPTESVKTFGSGDAYAAGLLYGLLNDCGLKYAMQLGTACASVALTSISCADGIPDFDEAEKVRKKYFERAEDAVE